MCKLLSVDRDNQNQFSFEMENLSKRIQQFLSGMTTPIF